MLSLLKHHLCSCYAASKNSALMYCLSIVLQKKCNYLVQVLDVREDMNKLKEDIHNLKHEMAKILQALTSRREMADSSQ